MYWVVLSDDSGSASQDLSVSTLLSMDEYGTHKILLIFYDPEGACAPLYVRSLPYGWFKDSMVLVMLPALTSPL